MVFKGADSTESMNNITKNVLPAGVYSFPGDPTISNDWIIPGTGLQINIQGPWVVRNADGMTIREDLTNRITFPSQGEYYVGLYSKYIVASDPILELKYISLSDYNVWSDKASFVIFARVKITANQITSSMIDLSLRTLPKGMFALASDLLSIGSIVRTAISVANLQALQVTAKPNEIVYVQQENAFYKYNGNGAWIQVDAPYTGVSNFNSIAGRQINLTTPFGGRNVGLPSPGYIVNICPLEGVDENGVYGNIGDWWVTRNNQFFTVFNTGTAKCLFGYHIVPLNSGNLTNHVPADTYVPTV
jgi:hypothetical protein